MTEQELETARATARAKYKKDEAALRHWLIGRGYFMALDAMELAIANHTGLRKDNIQPEVHHQLRIALFVRNLPDLMHREETITVAFTHDLIEDCGFEPDDITGRYGPLVGQASLAMSKEVRGIKRSEDEIFADMARSPIATIDKPADRNDNLMTMRGVFGPQKRLGYADFAEQRIIPLIKEGRRRFPRQDAAYGILRHLIGERIAYEREIAQISGVGA